MAIREIWFLKNSFISKIARNFYPCLEKEFFHILKNLSRTVDTIFMQIHLTTYHKIFLYEQLLKNIFEEYSGGLTLYAPTIKKVKHTQAIRSRLKAQCCRCKYYLGWWKGCLKVWPGKQTVTKKSNKFNCQRLCLPNLTNQHNSIWYLSLHCFVILHLIVWFSRCFFFLSGYVQVTLVIRFAFFHFSWSLLTDEFKYKKQDILYLGIFNSNVCKQSFNGDKLF